MWCGDSDLLYAGLRQGFRLPQIRRFRHVRTVWAYQMFGKKD
jgi:hypothetical protein